MKILFSVLALFFSVSVALAGNFEGTWKATIDTPNGGFELTYVFKMEGKNLTGKMTGMMGDIPVNNIVVKGDQLKFETTMQGMDGSQSTTIKHDCTFKDDDNIMMKVIGTPMGDSEMILKRQK